VRRHHNGRSDIAQSASSVPAPEFFWSTSCNIALSSERSATIRLALRSPLPQLTHFSRLRGLHVPVEFLLAGVALLGNAAPATELRARSPQVSRLKDPRNMFDRKTPLLHDETSYPEGLILSQNSLPNLSGYLGAYQKPLSQE